MQWRSGNWGKWIGLVDFMRIHGVKFHYPSYKNKRYPTIKKCVLPHSWSLNKIVRDDIEILLQGSLCPRRSGMWFNRSCSIVDFEYVLMRPGREKDLYNSYDVTGMVKAFLRSLATSSKKISCSCTPQSLETHLSTCRNIFSGVLHCLAISMNIPWCSWRRSGSGYYM